ncbi:hypothetical protein BY95_17175 [Escherichia coli O157:H7 str. K6687]|nr:hypothetical protein BY95_17175 [Escherichia coli O157:H7 str. K6687]
MMTPSRNLCHASSPCSTALTSIPVRCRIMSGVMLPPSAQRLSVSGIQELSLLRPVSVLTMRECRGEISGNRAAISRHPMFYPGRSAEC